ncbi:MAG: hypothetical protein ACLSHC_01740 [Bilophila wadsworthia]
MDHLLQRALLGRWLVGHGRVSIVAQRAGRRGAGIADLARMGRPACSPG